MVEKVKMLIEFINDERKIYEEQEEYEICQELVIIGEKLSDFILGYSNYYDIEILLLELCKMHGEIAYLEQDKDYSKAVFTINNHYFGFYISPEEYENLIAIQIERAESDKK